jgi:hypothetical protein
LRSRTPPIALHAARKDVRIGCVVSGQSMVRPTTTASLLSFHRIRVQASAYCQETIVVMIANALNKTQTVAKELRHTVGLTRFHFTALHFQSDTE